MPFKIFRYDEPRYYRFGLRLGVANLQHSGLRLGLKKTFGKIFQPINSYTRFPEYYLMGYHLQEYLQRFTTSYRARILDVGSPKCFGLFLAFYSHVEIHLTDIYEPAIKESRILWKAIKDRARGKPVFSIQDARALNYPQEAFDAVYSMSVIEHVEGKAGDSQSLKEMVRVLKPGGILLVTIPCGQTYVEQDCVGWEGASHRTGKEDRYFFQRIYTPGEVERRILKAVPNVVFLRAVTVRRKTGLISKLYGHLGRNGRALFGSLNPILSTALNVTQEGISIAPSSYGNTHSERDVYGDLILVWEKQRPKCDGKPPTHAPS